MLLLMGIMFLGEKNVPLLTPSIPMIGVKFCFVLWTRLVRDLYWMLSKNIILCVGSQNLNYLLYKQVLMSKDQIIQLQLKYAYIGISQ